VSYVSAQSLAWIEEFVVWKNSGGADWKLMEARAVEAFCILESEAAKEARNGER